MRRSFSFAFTVFRHVHSNRVSQDGEIGRPIFHGCGQQKGGNRKVWEQYSIIIDRDWTLIDEASSVQRQQGHNKRDLKTKNLRSPVVDYPYARLNITVS